MSSTLIQNRKEAIRSFIKIVGIPVTVNECIVYLNQVTQYGYVSTNQNSAVASMSTLLKEMTGIKRYKREGARDIVWYFEDYLSAENTLEGNPIRLFLYTHRRYLEGHTPVALLRVLSVKGSESSKYLLKLASRKDRLAMIRGDLARVKLGLEKQEEQVLVSGVVPG